MFEKPLDPGASMPRTGLKITPPRPQITDVCRVVRGLGIAVGMIRIIIISPLRGT
jgi:hypothetical protein